jgi:hypothetical protein
VEPPVSVYHTSYDPRAYPSFQITMPKCSLVKAEDLTDTERRNIISRVFEKMIIRWDEASVWGLEVRSGNRAASHFGWEGVSVLTVVYISMT